MDRYKVKVHRKRLIVISAEIRRRFNIGVGSHLELIVDNDKIYLVVPKDLRSAFGVDDEKALEVAKLNNSTRREEIKKEIRS